MFFGTGLLLYFLLMPLGRALGMKLGDQAVFALSGTFSNGVGIGIPFITYAFGEAGLVPLLMIISINSLVMLTLCSFLLEIGSGGGSGGRLLAKLGGAAHDELYRTGVGLATNAVVISTGASVFTLSVVLLLLRVQTR